MNDLFINRISINWMKGDISPYVRGIKALKGVDDMYFTKPVTFFVGENGTGKSTLLEAIAIACGYNPEGGTRNYDFSTYDSHSNLCDALIFRKSIRKPRWGYFYRAESFYNVATQEMEYADGAHPSERYHDRSHGEGFMKAVRGNLSPDSLYFFDEPEAALSPQRQLNILAEIYDTANAGSQFIIATHSPILLGLPGADIWNFDNEKIHPCEYEETGSYVITEAFINNRAMMLSKLINP